MKVKLICCESCKNEINWCGIQLESDCEFLDYSYHANPRKLHAKLQEIINNSQEYDLIILTYGRCSNAVIGLVSPNVPLVFPNTHDCIGLLLGSTEKHTKLMKEYTGTYFFSQGWLDYGRTPYDEYLEYKEKYGEEKALYLIKALYGRYNRALLIITPGMNNLEDYRKKVKQIAGFFGWEVNEITGDITLLETVIKGLSGPGAIRVEPGVPVPSDIYEKDAKLIT